MLQDASPARCANGQPYKGINVLMLWGEAVAQGCACPIWMTYK
jgi:antirestriction protein ArdC